MSRPRLTHQHLPKYVTVIGGAYWYRPPSGEYVRIGAVADGEHLVWRFMLDHAEPTAPPAPGALMNEFFDRYEREVLPLKTPRTQRDYRKALVVLRKAFGHMRPADLQPRDVGQFLDRPKGRIQANRQVAVLSSVCAKMVGRWYVMDRNPCADVERNPEQPRERYVTDEEFGAVYALANERMKIAMDLALLTGQRQGDLLALKWSDVTPEGIRFQQSKTGKKLLVAISPTLQSVLDRARRLPPKPRLDIGAYVLRTRDDERYNSSGFQSIWQRLMDKAERIGAVKERWTFHDIRAKSVSDSSTLEAAFERAGHATMAMTRGVYDRNYRKVVPLR